jgi:hypothetical protein
MFHSSEVLLLLLYIFFNQEINNTGFGYDLDYVIN